jgi:N-acetylglutamate synthase-like GNAT family acetyltransferase
LPTPDADGNPDDQLTCGRHAVLVGAVGIRDATADDFAAMASVFRRASLSNEGDRSNLVANPHYLELSDAAVLHGRSQVAVIDGQVIGFASVDPTGDGLELEALFVDPDWMRRGAGTALVSAIARRARGLGISTIDVDANPHALDFYRHSGFVEVGVVDSEFGPVPRMRLAVPLAD